MAIGFCNSNLDKLTYWQRLPCPGDYKKVKYNSRMVKNKFLNPIMGLDLAKPHVLTLYMVRPCPELSKNVSLLW